VTVIEWSDEYSVGIASIDDQHKKLVALINQLNTAMAAGEAASKLAEIFRGLAEYTQVHFAYEESLFDQFGYPQSETHIKQHRWLIQRIQQFKEEFGQAPSGAIGLELMQFMTNWLTDHIQVSDRAYSDYLLKRGVS